MIENNQLKNGSNIIHHIFEAQVLKYAEETAVMSEHVSLTYQEVNERANQLARTLCDHGIESEDVVAILIERSVEMYLSVLAVLKAGAAYLPIDIECPKERIQYMLNHSQAKLILSKKDIIERFGFQQTAINVQEQTSYHPDKTNLNIACQPSSLAYVIYTSGSTGMPKGVMVEHGSVANRIYWMQKEYPIGSSDTILQKTPITFDVSVWELFWWFFNGSRLFLMKPGAEKNVQAIIDTIAQHHITTIHFVPSMLNIFLDYILTCDCKKETESLLQVFCSGEALSSSCVEKFNRLLYSEGKPCLINLYGPTEATVDITHYNCTGLLNLKTVPIGKPIDNMKIYIIDEHHCLCPTGSTGELCVSGIGVARGYVNSPDLTQKYFVENPFVEGVRMYRTGDLAKWMTDGNIEYLGRMDQQVKIRGYRIELSEIEYHLLQHPSVKEAVVIDKLINEDQKILVAYTSCYQKTSVLELKRYLLRKLPDYMVPVSYVFLEALPQNANGKIDRKCLRAM